MSGWPSGYSAEVKVSTMFCQLEREFESHPVHFLILFQNFEKLSSKIGVSSNLVWAQKTSYPTISAHSALLPYEFEVAAKYGYRCLIEKVYQLFRIRKMENSSVKKV